MAKDTRSTKEIINDLKETISTEWRENIERVAAYLRFTNRFHEYSANNRMLIMAQNPNATLCGSFTTWQKLGRRPAGGTGIKIFSPAKRRFPVTDANGNPVLDENGDPKMVEYMTYISKYSTFDFADTSGDDLPDFTPDIENVNVETFAEALDRVIATLDVEIEETPTFVTQMNDTSGTVRDDLPLIKRAMEKATIIAFTLQKEDDTSFAERSWAAQAAAFATAARYGLDTTDYTSFMLPKIEDDLDLPKFLVRAARLSEEIEALDMGAPTGWAAAWGKQ